jgi:hypothetical protein
MNFRLKIASLLLLAVMVFVPLQSAAASGSIFEGQIIFGQSYTLKSGDTLNGDLLVFGGSVTIEQGATVNGNLVLFGGNLTLDGEVSGDVAVTGGSVALGAEAQVGGNLVTVGSSLSRAEGSQVNGQIYNTATSWISDGGYSGLPNSPVVVTPQPFIPAIRFNVNPLLTMMNALGQSALIAILAMLLMLFLAPHADRVAHAVIAQPLVTGGLGLLTALVAPVGLILLAVTIFLAPVAAVVLVALAAAALFGWIAVGYEIGQRFTKAIHQEWHPAFAAGLGTFVLTLLARALTAVPVIGCLGGLAPFLLGLAALGAVIMTRFGTQAVAVRAVQTAVVPPQPSGKKSG